MPCIYFTILYPRKKSARIFLERHFDIINLSKIPTRKTKEITDEPLIWRYFVVPLPTKLADSQLDEREFTVKCVFRVNTRIARHRLDVFG